MATSMPGSPVTPGLRERKKAATMRHVQGTALALFEEHGYEKVTIEEVAEAAEVSASTVYRYFGTKEGLVLHDEFDDRLLAAMAHYLQQGFTPWQAAETTLGVIEHEHFVVQEEATLARTRLWLEVPSVRAAAYLTVEEVVEEMARLMAGTGRWTLAQGRVVMSAIIWPFIAALKNWHEAGGQGGWQQHVGEAIAALKDNAPATDGLRGSR